MRLRVLVISILMLLTAAKDVLAVKYTSRQIAEYAKSTPQGVENDISSLVKYLTAPFDNDYDKAKSIAYWIASHIYYDTFLYNSAENKDTYLRTTYQEQTPSKLLQSKVGICVDYAELFSAMCRKAGITARKVNGYVYPSNLAYSKSVRDNYAHAWNYFYYRGKKVYVDTTFMAGGRLDSDKYPNSSKRKQALYKFKQENKRHSQTAPIYPYYFDFSYSKEKIERKRTRRER